MKAAAAPNLALLVMAIITRPSLSVRRDLIEMFHAMKSPAFNFNSCFYMPFWMRKRTRDTLKICVGLDRNRYFGGGCTLPDDLNQNQRLGSSLHMRVASSSVLTQYKSYSSTSLASSKSSTVTNDEECMLSLPPDNFSRYSKYLVRNSNGVDGMGGSANTIRDVKDDVLWVDALGETCYDGFHSGQHDSADDVSTRPGPFSILSWNILAQALYESHCESIGISHHPWPQRLRRIIQILSHADSDIVCLQECELHSFQYDLLPALSDLGYDGVAQEDKRSDGEKPTPVKEVTKHRDPRNHIAATFWKRDKFEPVAKTYVRTRSMTNVLRLKKTSGKKESSPTLAIINCHLEGNPKRFSERTHQLQHALTDLAKMMQRESDDPQLAPKNHQLNALVIAGDFNCELQSSACSTYLRIGRLGRQAGLGGIHGEDSLVIPPALLETDEATEILHPIVEWGRALPEEQVSDVSPHPFRRNGMTSAYPLWLGKDDAREHFTYIGTINKRPVPGLDQIWYSSTTVKRVALRRTVVDFLGEWGSENDNTIEQRRCQERMKILSTGLPDPSCTYPSDHLPIGGIFDWQCDTSSNEARTLTVVDAEGNTLDHSQNSSQPESLEFEVLQFESPKDELEYLVLHCPYDSVDQRLAVQFILSPVDPPLCTETKRKPTPIQLEQIKERRDKKGEVLSTSSLGVRPWLKKIWKVSKQVGSLERNTDRNRELKIDD
ncbi:hypothetical protein HJC23_002996 [Cyclotella cryptica]|uniref:Endonuclease/exonuclease/phosphatase domain-containing protein n=1 Tax=Cyclotella cryptica TaxID=29204 RepID=A0ABD3PSN2_9STRA|eukprot:CCRYP_011804-RA/>CCRYP_011804-RA protein AED:0.40 eAED:0.40 QI:0/-1/0/1/-1/1/1/0/718